MNYTMPEHTIPPVDLVLTLSVEELKQELCKRLNIQTPGGRIAFDYACDNIVLLDRKHRDYGPLNIASHGAYGVVVRMSDKQARLNNLYRGGKRRKTVNESIRDTFKDIGNYSIIAQMCEDGKWPLT